MSVDIIDKNLIKIVREEGIQYIVDFLHNEGHEDVNVTEVDDGETILIQTPSHITTDGGLTYKRSGWSNTVGMSRTRMYVNPCFRKEFPVIKSSYSIENSLMMTLKEHIENIPNMIREDKLKKILDK